jgi:hypothetical protein
MIASTVQLGHGMEWLHSTDPDPSAKGSAQDKLTSSILVGAFSPVQNPVWIW